MVVYISGHSYKYELEKLIRLFFPFEKISFKPYEKTPDDLFFAVTTVIKSGDNFLLNAVLNQGVKRFEKQKSVGGELPPGQDLETEKERALAAALFECLCALTGYRPQWGILTGVRPAKLYRRIQAEMGSGTDSFFRQHFFVQEHKLSLLKKTAAREEKIIGLSKSNSVSIYLSVPFCPSRCSYCSFVSHSVDQAKGLISQYVPLLCREIEQIGELVRRLGLKVETVYMGGGTPTTLSAEQLFQVLSLAKLSFGGSFREFTVEAGRPDTITAEKLAALKSCGVDRVSINPQTMNDAVLAQIGRRHTAAQTVEAFALARRAGFDHINMDLIAGLPGDSLESFERTLQQVLALNPESVTVHALAFKRAANLVTGGEAFAINTGSVAAKMVDLAEEMLEKQGILPYYMYRQSKTVGNLENVGYAKNGREGLYNVFIMDETHSILGCGASAVTKLRQPGTSNIERIFNYKYPYEYVNRFEEMLKRKQQVEAFYREYVNTDQQIGAAKSQAAD